MRAIIKDVRKWATDRGLIKSGNAPKQFEKLLEEIEELRVAIKNNDLPNIIDSVGDAQVCLINLSACYSLDYDKCLESAYNEIKERKGKTVNGIFVKEVEVK